MSSRMLLTAVVLALTIGAGNMSSALGREQGRLAAFAARQDLHDEVCICMADGRISPQERAEILKAARKILTPEEYPGFKANLDRVSPPVPMEEKLISTVVKKKPPVASKPSNPELPLNVTPEESPVFEENLDQVSPPVPVEEKPHTTVAKKKPQTASKSTKSTLPWGFPWSSTAKKPAKKHKKSGEMIVTDEKEADEVILSDRVAKSR
jgi:hypothetical protein